MSMLKTEHPVDISVGIVSPSARKFEAILPQIYGEEAPAEEKPAAQAAPIAPLMSPKLAPAAAAVSGQAFPIGTTPVFSVAVSAPLHWAATTVNSIAACYIRKLYPRPGGDFCRVTAAKAPSQPQAPAVKAEDAAVDAAQDDDELDIQLDEDVTLNLLLSLCNRSTQSSGNLADVAQC